MAIFPFKVTTLLKGGTATVPESNDFSKIHFSLEPHWLKVKQSFRVAIFVKSAVENYGRREGVRRSYSSKHYEVNFRNYSQFHLKCMFSRAFEWPLR